MQKSVEDMEEEWNNGDQKRKIELNFRIWKLALININRENIFVYFPKLFLSLELEWH
jgi:hypothetical protein